VVCPNALASIALLQVVCGAFFLQDLIVSILGLRRKPVSWTWHESIEIMATVGLLLGMALGAVVVHNLIRQQRIDAALLQAASGEFYRFVQNEFDAWALTASERDIPMFMLKGLSNHEIAALRHTSEGTIKAQCTSIIRKSGVAGRAQLLSMFIEELLADSGDAETTGRTRRKTA